MRNCMPPLASQGTGACPLGFFPIVQKPCFHVSGADVWVGAQARANRLPEYDPCVDLEVATYLNRPDVQAALHVNTSGQLPGPWADCSDTVKYSRYARVQSTSICHC